MLPTLREERRQTYSPVLPDQPGERQGAAGADRGRRSGDGLVRYTDPATGEAVEQSILSGGAKLQWKVDWAMRWVALGVDYEMSGKDLIDSVIQSSKIARVLGARPPEGFNYELFLDENGEKISKTKGNGVTIDEWLTYGPEESLSFYIYREPKRAKQLSFGSSPGRSTNISQFLAAYPGQPWDRERLGNPVHHSPCRASCRRAAASHFALPSTSSASRLDDDKGLPLAFVSATPRASPETNPDLDALLGYALTYFRDFVAGSLRRRAPDEKEAGALGDLDAQLAELPADTPGDDIQNIVFEVGKAHRFENLRDWFKALYETLLGTSQGPRMGSFIALYGIDNSRKLIAEALAGRSAS
jgi:lysyl-tRNA synthetase class 1